MNVDEVAMLPMTEDLKQTLFTVIQLTTDEDVAETKVFCDRFGESVDLVYPESYFDVVKEPMDLALLSNLLILDEFDSFF